MKIRIERWGMLILFFLLAPVITYSQDPCVNQTDMVCGTEYPYSLPAAAGVWNPPGPWGTPGSEAVFSYTPITSGVYDILVTNNDYWVDLFFQAGVCGPAGWNYVNDIFTSEVNSLNLIAGVTYFFLLDDENTTASNGRITIACPCIPPPGGIDETINVISNITNSISSTFGACNDCNYRASSDKVIEIVIICPGDYTFSTCGGATWDTYLYLSTLPCGGTIIGENDDACGLQSSITINLNVGTYYLIIEAWSSNAAGAYDLEITTTCAFLPLPIELVFFEGENIDGKNLLNWQTISELNNDFFVVERSTDGIKFNELEIIPAHGATNGTTNYSITDESFISGINYYRLTQVDYDGNLEVFSVIAINSAVEVDIAIFPNPGSGIMNIDLGKKWINLELYIQNEIGQEIFSAFYPSSSKQIVLDLKVKSGMYFLTLKSESESLFRKLIIN